MFASDAGCDDGPVESSAVVTAEVGIRPPIGVRSTIGRDRVRNESPSPSTIGRVLAGSDDPQSAADRLVEPALDRSDGDDLTAIVIDHLGDGS